MSWTYEVDTAKFYHNGSFAFKALYAGAPGYKNDSQYECVKDKGPLPRGTYTIGSPHANPRTGPYTMNLEPDNSNNMCGRNLFRIHGESAAHPGAASDGCIIANIADRKAIWNSGDRELIVK